MPDSNASALPRDRSHLLTEQRNPRSMDLHTLSVEQLVDLMNEQDRTLPEAVRRACPELTAFIKTLEQRFKQGGRLIYMGAGTSGRLGVLDAAEMPPTFQIDPGRVVGIIAGGNAALRRSSEGKEDDPRGALDELERLALNRHDSILGIATSGSTAYVLGGLELTKHFDKSALTGLLVCTPMDQPAFVDHLITIETGPEVITGSTRMKAGTATKLVLNTISTTLMIRTGRVYQNLMVDLRATNDKLRDRAARIISTLTGLDRAQCFALLDRAEGDVKTAILMHQRALERTDALRVLEKAGGHLDQALGLEGFEMRNPGGPADT